MLDSLLWEVNMKYKRNPVTLVIAVSPLLFMLLVLLSLFIAEDALVINIGIVALRQVRIFVEVICLICFMWLLIVGVAYFKKPKVKEGFNVDGTVRKRIEAALCLFSSFELSHNDNTWFLLNNIREDVKTVLNFYLSLNDLVVDDWGRIVQPREGGGRTTSVSIMGKTGIKKMCDGWIAVIDKEEYINAFAKAKWIGYREK